jgi:hypothetical protein
VRRRGRYRSPDGFIWKLLCIALRSDKGEDIVRRPGVRASMNYGHRLNRRRTRYVEIADLGFRSKTIVKCCNWMKDQVNLDVW